MKSIWRCSVHLKKVTTLREKRAPDMTELKRWSVICELPKPPDLSDPRLHSFH